VRCVVIGGNGFLGSSLVDQLVERGHEVTVFDRFSSGRRFFLSEPSHVVTGDFFDDAAVDSVLSGQDAVFHFLSTTSPILSVEDPSLDLRTNVARTVELMSSSVRAGVGRFFFASTGGAIYGDQGRDRYSESDAVYPSSPYGIGKLTIENYLRFFRAQHGLNSIALRISNPYGPRQHGGRSQGLIPIALSAVASGEPVVRYGDGGMVRDYIHADDVVRMIATIAEADPQHETYNLGSGVGTSLMTVLDTLRRVTGVDFQVDERPVPATFVDRVVLDTQRFVREFGQPQIATLDEGVAETWEAIRVSDSR
jgi:UDP-glucose 4-epimerase